LSKRLLSRIDLDALFDQLRVEPIAFSECFIAPAWALAFSATPASGLHYVLHGEGELVLGSGAPVPFGPETLLVTLRDTPYRIQARSTPEARTGCGGVVAVTIDLGQPTLKRWQAGSDEPALKIVCGHFRAIQAGDRDLFGALDAPVVEHSGKDSVGSLMPLIRTELSGNNTGGRTMAAAMLRQVLVILLRRGLAEQQSWLGALDLVSDEQVMRAFSAMVHEPGAAHSVMSLAQLACLSRSAFIKRFQASFGHPPATVLRELRLLAAADRLLRSRASVEQVARGVGYASPSSFSRAFTTRFGVNPAAYQASAEE